MYDGLLLSILMFTSNYDVCVSTKIYKKNNFLCVAYGQYPNMFECFFYIYTKNIGNFENVFLHGFLKHNKIIFLHFWILQHVCKTPKGIGQYSKKYKNLILGGNSSIIHR